jgi:hypothetical protein
MNLKDLIKECINELNIWNSNTLIVDRETIGGYRQIQTWNITGQSFEDIVRKFIKTYKIISKDVIEYVDMKTGETIKGPKYDTTRQTIKGRTVAHVLPPGIYQKEPMELMQHEPRDRMDLKESFRDLIREVIFEVKTSKRKDNNENKTDNSKDVGREDKAYLRNRKNDEKADNDADLTNEALRQLLEKEAHKVDDTIKVYWDDHKDLKVDASEKLYIKINRRFTNSFDVEAYKRMADRIYAINLTLEQLKDFVRVNLEKINGPDCKTTAYNKSIDHKIDKTNAPKKDDPKPNSIKQKEVDNLKK